MKHGTCQLNGRCGFPGYWALAAIAASFLAGSGSAQAEPPQQGAQPVRVFSDASAQTAAPTPAPAATPETAPKPAVAPGAANAPVQPITLATPTKASLAARKSAYTIKVSGEDWVDTHIVVAPPDRLVFTAKGSAKLADGRSVAPEGATRGWKDMLRQFPANDAGAGALIGRIGSDAAVTAFAIGAGKTLDVTTAGELFLRINATSELAPQGDFNVEIKLSQEHASASAPAANAPALEKLVSPALFEQIPRRVQDQTGDPGDMVNFAIIGTQAQVEKAFANAGWVKVDKTTQDAVVHGLLSTLSHQAYTEMPMSTLFLFGRSQDLSFARADPIAVAAIRHHLRVWKSTETVDGRPLWVGSATHDNGFERDQRNGGVTHHIDAEIDKERDFIEDSFASAGDLSAAAYVLPSHPLQTAKTATGGSFQSDGRVVVMLLR